MIVNMLGPMLIKQYRRLPRNFRDKLHHILHRFNSNVFLLQLCGFRHRLTCKRLRCFEFVNLRIGESGIFENWISTNYQVICANFLDATKPLKGVKNLQFVIADNVIEHLSLTNGNIMLENLYNAMLPGATLRLSTPNLRELASKYLESDFYALEQLKIDLNQHSVAFQYLPDILRVQFTSFGHHKGYLYDFQTLQLLLAKNGFKNIRQVETSKSSLMPLKNAENRKSPSDKWAQLCIEAEK